MNLLQLRFSASAIENQRVLTALQAAFSAYRHMNSDYRIGLARDGQRWYLDVYIGGAPFGPDQELVTSTLIRQGVPFDIAYSPLGVDGDAVDMMYGLRRAGDSEIVWHDDAPAIDGGCETRELTPDALGLLGIDLQLFDTGVETIAYSPEFASKLRDLNPRMVDQLIESVSDNPLIRETARYLAVRHSQAARVA
jgi:hypothetical protein